MFSEFYKKKTMKLGLDSWCKTCKNKDRKRYQRWTGYKEAGKEYYHNNKEIWRGIKARRRASKANATPPWSSCEWQEFAIKELYLTASVRSLTTGVPHEVDHIVPLSSSKVCGLHVIENLQILTQKENRQKSNKY